MRDARRTAPFLRGDRFVVLMIAMLVAVGLTGLTTTAIAGDSAAVAGKKKKKKCPAGTTKKVVKKKNGKKKVTCVPNAAPPTTPPQGTATLAISPASLNFPDEQHGGAPGPTQTFTVSNTGTGTSGALTTAIVDFDDPVALDAPAFVVMTSTCGAALPPGGSCTVGVAFDPESNGGDATYGSFLRVSGTPGGSPQATMTGLAQ